MNNSNYGNYNGSGYPTYQQYPSGVPYAPNYNSAYGYGQPVPGPTLYPQQHHGYQPMGYHLPPAREGFRWEMVTTMQSSFGPLSDGSWGPVMIPVTSMVEVEDETYVPRKPSVKKVSVEEAEGTPISQEAEKAQSQSSKILQGEKAREEKKETPERTPDLDEEGEYGAVATLSSSPADLLQAPLSPVEKNLMETLLSKPVQPAKADVARREPTHKTAMKDYKTHYRGSWGTAYPLRKGNLYRYEEMSQWGFEDWKEAALHELPLEIIDNLDRLAHFEGTYVTKKGKCFMYLIPCTMESKGRFEYSLDDAVIEFTISPSGKPVHLFLRPLEGRDEDFLKKVLSENKKVYEEARNKAEYPDLKDSLKFKKVNRYLQVGKPIDDGLFVTFKSKYDIEIKIPKKRFL